MPAEKDGKYIGANGVEYESRHFAAQTLKGDFGGGGAAATGFLGNLLALVPLLIFLAFIGFFVLVSIYFIIAAAHSLWMIAKILYLFPLMFIVAFAVSVFLRIFFRRIPFIKLLSFLAFVVMSVFGFIGVHNYYSKVSNTYLSSVYSSDFIQAMPDGRLPVVYEKRGQKGNVLAELSLDEKVQVNGITLNRQEYNITTNAGITGWLVREAFPENAASMLAFAISLNGGDSEDDIAVDRQYRRLMEQYMDVTGGEKVTTRGPFGGQVTYTTQIQAVISPKTLNRSIRVNAQAPIIRVSAPLYKKGAELEDSGVAVSLSNIVYADDCTILYLTAEYTTERTIIRGASNMNAWKNGFVVTDLTTGESWPMYHADLDRLYRSESDGTTSKSELVLFFPPFKSRNFSLTNDADPLPPIRTGGLHSVANLLINLLAGGIEEVFVDYSFPAVQVR